MNKEISLEDYIEAYQLINKHKKMIANIDTDFFIGFAEKMMSELQRLQEIETEHQEINGILRTKIKEYEKIEQISKSVTLEDVERTAREFEQYVSKDKIRDKIANYLEFFLIDNMMYEDSQKEFKRLLKWTKELLGE